MYSLSSLMHHDTETEINGKWVPARPLRACGLEGLRIRLREAWAVLCGRADAFTWPEGQ